MRWPSMHLLMGQTARTWTLSCGRLTQRSIFVCAGKGQNVQVNAGIQPDAIRTIVAFGDSWTSNGANGTVPVPPLLHPPLPSAGSQYTENRRASNGYIWVEQMANALGAKLLDYAWGGAIIDRLAWNTTKDEPLPPVGRTDFTDETRLFFRQGRYLDPLQPNTTLYTVAFGINDNGQYQLEGGDWDIAYSTYTEQLNRLQSFGAKNILIHGMYTSHPEVDLLQSRIFAYLRNAREVNGTNVAFVDLARLFTAIVQDGLPFGYPNGTSTCLLNATSTLGGCEDPDREVFYIPGHPSRATHELIGLYTSAVLDACRTE